MKKIEPRRQKFLLHRAERKAMHERERRRKRKHDRRQGKQSHPKPRFAGSISASETDFTLQMPASVCVYSAEDSKILLRIIHKIETVAKKIA